MTEDHPGPKAIMCAITIEAHDWRDLINQLRSIAYRMHEAEREDEQALDVVSGGGYAIKAERDGSRTREAYEQELMSWWERRRRPVIK